MNAWQMTLEELLADSFVPVKKPMHLGAWSYECPICGAAVGVLRSDMGMIYQREACVNGHVVDWRDKQ